MASVFRTDLIDSERERFQRVPCGLRLTYRKAGWMLRKVVNMTTRVIAKSDQGRDFWKGQAYRHMSSPLRTGRCVSLRQLAADPLAGCAVPPRTLRAIHQATAAAGW